MKHSVHVEHMIISHHFPSLTSNGVRATEKMPNNVNGLGSTAVFVGDMASSGGFLFMGAFSLISLDVRKS